MRYISINKKDIKSFKEILAYFRLPDPKFAGARLNLLREYYYLHGKIVNI